ncbi:hypothetical protein [Streptococcus sp. Marseille-Q0941]|uniref:hypothetical protein n=1 Tax=Streptococcus sp. Marseille-Q0941 TaxID=2942206 RepID=UPI002073E346|nr:hypothetical protein [Streptococcus sp. Marseille-Q0941]
MRLAYFVNVKFFGTNFGTKNKMTSKKALISRLLPVDLDAPCRNLEGFIILNVIKNIEI